MGEGHPRIPAELVPFVTSGVSILVGTSDEHARPHATRAVGVKVHESRDALTVFLADAPAARAIANLRATGRIALTFTRPVDHRSIQVKGAVTGMRAATDEERATVTAHLSAWGEHVELVGLPRALAARVTDWPATAIDVRLEAIFNRTPGPSAGERLASPSS